jgi:hypothetical protein
MDGLIVPMRVIKMLIENPGVIQIILIRSFSNPVVCRQLAEKEVDGLLVGHLRVCSFDRSIV